MHSHHQHCSSKAGQFQPTDLTYSDGSGYGTVSAQVLPGQPPPPPPNYQAGKENIGADPDLLSINNLHLGPDNHKAGGDALDIYPNRHRHQCLTPSKQDLDHGVTKQYDSYVVLLFCLTIKTSSAQGCVVVFAHSQDPWRTSPTKKTHGSEPTTTSYSLPSKPCAFKIPSQTCLI